MKLKNYTILMVICWIMLFAGCSHLPISIQVVGDEELASLDNIAITTATEVIKAKYPEKVDTIVRYCDIALNADDEMFEAYFNNGIQMLPDQFISDPAIRGAVKGILGSFKVDIDTNAIDFDMGALRRARQIMTSFRNMLD